MTVKGVLHKVADDIRDADTPGAFEDQLAQEAERYLANLAAFALWCELHGSVRRGDTAPGC